LTRDATAAVYDASFYPRATQNDRQERTYDGVTLLSRMETAYPSRFVGDVDDAGITNGRANNWVTFFLARWATEFPWFDYETVPQLRMPVPGENGVAKPSEYDEEFSLLNPFPVRQGVVVSRAFSFPQEPGNQLSMYQMLERLLSPFPGAVFFQNASGRLQIVPAYGPDADETPYKTLGADDVASQSLGEPSIGTIVNRATVSSRGFVRSEAVAVMQPAWFQVGGNDQLGRTNWYTPPGDRVNMQATEDGSILQEGLEPGQFAAQLGVLWPIATDSLPAGDGIGIGTVADPLITVGWARYSNDSLDDSGATGFTLVSELIPFTASGWTTVGTFSASAVNFTLLGRWRDEQQAIELTLASGAKFEQDCFIAPCSTLIAEITLNDSSVGYTETSGVSVTFGTTETSEENPIPGADGTDAVTASQTTYGVLETRVDVDGYVLDAGQALGMAQGIVLGNLTPRAIRSLDLGWRGSTVALFDDRGRLFGTPDSGEGLLVGVEYTDDFISVTGGKRVGIEETVPSLPGFIPTDVTWLQNEDGSLWTNEDGSLSEPA
jgi:hypothetical protein